MAVWDAAVIMVWTTYIGIVTYAGLESERGPKIPLL
tara:strand:+ start:98 stop:205 length:108 start_codon:yes stop_codon:yes gene_type:complete